VCICGQLDHRDSRDDTGAHTEHRQSGHSGGQAPAGFSDGGLPIGIQIVGPNQGDLSCLQLAHAYDQATRWPERVRPALLG